MLITKLSPLTQTFLKKLSLAWLIIDHKVFIESSDYTINLDKWSESHISVVYLIQNASFEYQTYIKHDLLTWERHMDRETS